ncbi:MAG TPA: 4-hydroxythreonine-4-phosphate dehydrogenase PdxA [Hyphomonadaceae bacterium]|jgi:4-hydroxythreonine-4-phosphate dehydrogenase|nr:4-hydroxythreonine-4-phosphate dehydrogenase PdxA [Hyphomonadaceae bacterium]
MPGGSLPLAVTMGDPAGVGPVITWKAYESFRARSRRFFVIADPRVLNAIRPAGSPNYPIKLIASPDEAASAFEEGLPVMPITCPVPKPGEPDPASATAVLDSIRLAVMQVQSGKAAAVVTNPIAKALLYRAGFKHPGHTEFLAELAAKDGVAPRPVMMLVGGGLRVALCTIHRPLSTVPTALSADLIADVGRITDAAMKQDFGFANPRLGLCGVNPHAGEDGEIGREEIEYVNPAAQRLRDAGISCSNARPGDTIFREALDGRFDAVIAMFHDQGLIPVKTLDMWGGVNVTLGLPFIRTSPDHGVAYDAAASGKARPDSLIAALDLAGQMAVARASAKAGQKVAK